MKRIFFASVLFSVIIFSCKKNEEPNPPASSTDPKTGSKWTYKATNYNEAGTVTSTSNVNFTGTEITVNGNKWIALTEQISGVPLIALQKRTEGWWYLPSPVSNLVSSLWFKYPATVNETYAYVYGTCKVLNINTSVTVPAGTYNGCYFVQGDDTNSKEDEFWFTTTGPVLVRFDTYDEKAAGPASNVYRKQSLELVSYTP